MKKLWNGRALDQTEWHLRALPLGKEHHQQAAKERSDTQKELQYDQEPDKSIWFGLFSIFYTSRNVVIRT